MYMYVYIYIYIYIHTQVYTYIHTHTWDESGRLISLGERESLESRRCWRQQLLREA